MGNSSTPEEFQNEFELFETCLTSTVMAATIILFAGPKYILLPIQKSKISFIGPYILLFFAIKIR